MPAKQHSPSLLPVDLYDLTEEDKKRFAQEERNGMTHPQNPMLNEVALQVSPNKITSPRIQQIIRRLVDVASNQQQGNQQDKQRRTLVGLAAPQIGISLRIIAVDTKITPDRKKPGKLECFVNPEIIWRSRETEEAREGCFSAGPVWGLVRRPVAVKIRALTPEGRHTERIFEGFTARIIQHECDHLDGFRFADRIKSDKKRHWVHTEELQEYPKHITHWQRLCTRQRWEAFKGST
jgi:peptide deformylase